MKTTTVVYLVVVLAVGFFLYGEARAAIDRVNARRENGFGQDGAVR